MDKNWYILYTKPGTEKRVAASLAKKGIEHYLPLCYKAKSSAAFTKPAKEPLFEGYVFVETTLDELMKIQKAVGAMSVVYWKGIPVHLLTQEMVRLKNFISQNHAIDLKPWIRNNTTAEISPGYSADIIDEGFTTTVVKNVSSILMNSLNLILVARKHSAIVSEYIAN